MARTILLADDSVTIQKVVELTFMDEDYEVVAVGNGDEAVRRLDDVDPDLVIADVHMPGANGFDLCRAAKERNPSTPVLLLVGTFEPFQEADAEAAGADGHLKKPFDSQELLRRVDELLSAGAAPDLSESMGLEDAEPGFEAVGMESVEEIEPIEDVEEIEPIGEDSWEDLEEVEASPLQVEPPADMGGFELERSPWDEAEDEEPVEVHRAEGLQNVETLGAPSDLASEGVEEAADVERTPLPDDDRRVETVEPAVSHATGNGAGLSDADVDRIARRVAEILGDGMLREIAWEVLPDLAEVVIKDRLRELERQVE